MSDKLNSVEFTLDRGTESILLKVGYSIVYAEGDGFPMTVQIIWINPANISTILTEDEWDTVHAFIYREESQHLKRGMKALKTYEPEHRSSLDPFI